METFIEYLLTCSSILSGKSFSILLGETNEQPAITRMLF